MKKFIFALSVASLFLLSCGTGASKQEAEEEQAKEVTKLDSLSEQIDQTKKSIEESTKELDELVNNL